MEGEYPYIGSLLTMVIKHLLDGMILQVPNLQVCVLFVINGPFGFSSIVVCFFWKQKNGALTWHNSSTRQKWRQSLKISSSQRGQRTWPKIEYTPDRKLTEMEPKLIDGLFVDILPFFVGTIFLKVSEVSLPECHVSEVKQFPS